MSPAPEAQERYPATLGSQFRRHAPQFVLGTMMLAGFQLAMNRIDLQAKAAIDDIFGVAPSTAWRPAAMMLGLAVSAFVARVASRWYMFNAGRDAEYELRSELLAKLHQLGAAFYRRMPAGEIMSRSTSDLQQVRMLMGFGVMNLINVGFAFASALEVMAGQSVKLTLACILNLPLATLLSRSVSRRLYQRMRDNQAALGRMSDVLQANLAGVRVVRSFALEGHERDRFEQTNAEYLRASLALARLRGSFAPTIGAVAALGTLVFFWYGSSLLLLGPDRGGISPGAFFAFWSAFARMAWPMIAVGFALSVVQRGRAGFARLRDIFDAVPEVVDGPRRAPRHVSGSLCVEHLSFAYGDRKVLDDVTFRVAPGESLAIVGRTGSGKSTLSMLLARLLPTPAGTVRIDGVDVCDLPLQAVRSAIGYAQQDAFLFSTTVARNIAFALDRPDAPDAEAKIRDAAREAQVFDEAMSLPEGFDTVVGERGVQLSGGQKQRIALARAMMHGDGANDPKILILDDPLSAVDTKTESAILEAIDRQASRRTVLLVTHRIVAASRCDRILVLDEGQVVERGTHEELVRAGGIYAAFAEEQRMARELEDIDLPPRRGGGQRAGTVGGVVSASGTVSPPRAPARAEQTLKKFHEEGAIGKAYDGRLLRRLWPFVRPHSRYILLSLGTLAFVSAINLGRPLLMGDVVRQADLRNAHGLLVDGAGLAVLLVLVQALTFVQMYAMQVAGARAMSDLRSTIFRFFQRLRLRYYDRTPVGRLVTRATNDVDAISELFASGALNAMGDVIALVGIVAMMISLDWRMSVVSFLALPIVGAIVAFVRTRSRAAYRDVRSRTARLNAFLNEQVNGIAVVQAFVRERAMAAEFDEINVGYRDANKSAIYYEAVLDAAIEMVSTLCVASILWFAGLRRVGDHRITFALLVTFTQYIRQFFEPVSLLSQRYTLLQSAMAGAERVFELLDETDVSPGALEPEDCCPSGPPGEALALEHVDFEYKPGAPVLRDVTFTARRGERIALVGATGAGKTTVASLLLRLYEPLGGAVRVEGRDVRGYEPQVLRRLFSVVPQDVFLFAGTILSNVAISDESPDRARAEDALRRIGALELFNRRSNGGADGAKGHGLDARVDERGMNFSAGERQLLAFARAIYRDAPLLVLDEATASVDSDTEARLQRALEEVVRGRTALVIAHRLSTIRAADRIVCFHKGRVVEVGTHAELLASGGVYARLYRMQSAHEQAIAAERRVHSEPVAQTPP